MPVTPMQARPVRFVRILIVALAAALAFASPVLAQWPTACVDLNDVVETHLGSHANVGIYQRVFGEQAEQACQSDHRDDVRAVFAWAFDGEAAGPIAPTPWPADRVALSDIVVSALRQHRATSRSISRLRRRLRRRVRPARARQDVRGYF